MFYGRLTWQTHVVSLAEAVKLRRAGRVVVRMPYLPAAVHLPDR